MTFMLIILPKQFAFRFSKRYIKISLWVISFIITLYDLEDRYFKILLSLTKELDEKGIRISDYLNTLFKRNRK